MTVRLMKVVAFALIVVIAAAVAFSLGGEKGSAQPPGNRDVTPSTGPEGDALRMIKEGRQTFRFDTFGDEAFWGDALGLHKALAGAKLGGVGPGVSPRPPSRSA